ncbi:MAG: LLM class flavin-dependent oxidoreductase [Mycobacteriaceae bacterium]|nr:LLM class flavin-dependent oxidoreductase [Mycobacteriaceae bacterium]
MKLGISMEPLGTQADRSLILDTSQQIEDLGFDFIFMSGHILANALGSALDPLVLLAAVGAATTRIRLATSVLVLPYYQPVVLANQAASLDVLSGGRFVLAVGTGWNNDEFDAVGISMRERGGLLHE